MQYKYEILIAILSVSFIMAMIFLQPKYKKFKSLTLFDAIWKWKWKGRQIYALTCHCPTCKNELIFDDEIAKASRDLNSKMTYLFCKHCDEEIGKVQGGDKEYLINLVKREIIKRLKEFS